jgi:hypothetical protein
MHHVSLTCIIVTGGPDPDYDNIMRPPRKVTKDICTRIFEFFMY